MLGLFALLYVVLHILSYLAFMLGWQWLTMVEERFPRSYILGSLRMS